MGDIKLFKEEKYLQQQENYGIDRQRNLIQLRYYSRLIIHKNFAYTLNT